MMRITDLKIMPLILHREDPEWRFALGGTDKSRGFIIKLTADNGLIGLGYTYASAHFGVVGHARSSKMIIDATKPVHRSYAEECKPKPDVMEKVIANWDKYGIPL